MINSVDGKEYLPRFFKKITGNQDLGAMSNHFELRKKRD
jgi:hypothetical protein